MKQNLTVITSQGQYVAHTPSAEAAACYNLLDGYEIHRGQDGKPIFSANVASPSVPSLVWELSKERRIYLYVESFAQCIKVDASTLGDLACRMTFRNCGRPVTFYIDANDNDYIVISVSSSK